MSSEQGQVPEPQKKGGCSKVLIGCGIAFLIVLLICGGVGYYVYTNAKSIAVNFAKGLITSTIEQSELPEADKQAIIEQVDRVADEYVAGNISNEQLQEIMSNLADSPLLSLGMLYMIETQYMDGTGLSAEEKDEAQLTLRRVRRGVADGNISVMALQGATDAVSDENAEGKKVIKNKSEVTTEEVKALFANLKALADEAEVSDDPEDVNVGEEYKKAVDEALAN